MQPSEKFVAYIDILGFSNLVHASERGEGLSLDEILEVVAMLGQPEDRRRFEAYGPMMCPKSRFERRDLDFRIIQISDCAILSAEVSPAGVINLVERSWSAVIRLLAKGLLCRGYITRGLIYHTENQVIGSAYQAAHEKDRFVTAFARDASDDGTPFVEIDPAITKYVAMETDDCVRKMFDRLVRSDGNVTAIFPFKLLSHSFGIGSAFDAAKERQSNDNLRRSLKDMRTKVLGYVTSASRRAQTKAAHYVNAIDRQLVECDRTDEMIDRLSGRFPRS